MTRAGLRVIGGRLRGRRLSVPDGSGLRPTPDRVRETLFNWLQPVIAGSRCLDLFAGSGALGLEAHSRGAAEVVMVERARAVAQGLRTTVERWGLEGVRVEQAEALAWLERPGRGFDIAFLDPPYTLGLLEPSCTRLAQGGWMTDGGLVYLESATAIGLPPLPRGWSLIRQRRAGEVCYGLAETRRSEETLVS